MHPQFLAENSLWVEEWGRAGKRYLNIHAPHATVQSHGGGGVCIKARQWREALVTVAAGIWRVEARAGVLLKCPGSWLTQRHTLAMSPSSVGT